MADPSTRRLTKRDVEVLLGTYDKDPVHAVTIALRRLLDQQGATFDELLDVLVTQRRVSIARRDALSRRETSALDDVAGELNELRTLPTTDRPS